MACNCGKRKKKPTQQGAAKPKPPTPADDAKSQFMLITASGQMQRFGSKLEAEAANERMGATGQVRPV